MTDKKWLFALFVIAILAPGAYAQGLTPADILLTNGAVYKIDGPRGWAEAICITNGQISFVGSSIEAQKFKGPNTSIVDLRGKMVLPGFTDSHLHLAGGGVLTLQCDVAEATALKELEKGIREYAESHKQSPWVLGFGWALPLYPGANPKKEDLDRLVPDRPAMIESADGHSVWVNSRAIAIAGVTKNTPDPVNGRIERDPVTGEASGTFREDATYLIRNVAPKPTIDDFLQGINTAQKIANAFGITSIIDPTPFEPDQLQRVLDAYKKADDTGQLSLRVKGSFFASPKRGLEQVGQMVAMRPRYKGNFFDVNTVKIMVDGVIEAGTAALLQPYIGKLNGEGTPMWKQDALNEMVTALDKEGFQIHIHAIGDRGVRMAFDAFEAAIKANGSHDARHHIAHLELIDPADIPRFQKLNVLANFQGFWMTADEYITDLTIPVLGTKRSRWLYPINSVARTGAMIVGGSDWKVSSMNPLDAIQVAATRKRFPKGDGAVWLPEELVSVKTMIEAYTINGAYGSFRESISGSIEVGKSADLVVLDQTLFAVPPEKIHAVKVAMTILKGKVVFQDADGLK